MIESGQADIGLASVIDAARFGFAMLPVGSIGCDGPTLTVRVYSQVPFNQVSTLHADTDSHTSVILCQIILRQVFGASPALMDFDANRTEHWPETVLLIGDKVVTDAPSADQYPHQLDLGAAWKELTGLPFAYAVWMCRADRVADEAIHRAAALLDRQRRHNRTRLQWVAAETAGEHRWPPDLALRYLGDLLRFEIGPREREAISTFLSMAADAGLAPSSVHRWADATPVGAP